MFESLSTMNGAYIAPPTTSALVDRIQPPSGLVEDTFDHTVEILATTFHDDPFMRYFQFDEEGGRQTKLSYEYLKPVMTGIIESFIEEEGATLITLPGKDLTTVWSIQTVEAGGHSNNLPVPLRELLDLSSQALKKSVPLGQRYIHIIVVGNRDSTRGVYSKVVRSMLRLADDLGLPVYGEATNEHSRDVHKHLGFEVGEVFYVGQGRVGADGTAQEGGSGVPHWPILYKPTSVKKVG